MKILIVINTPTISEKMFSKAISQRPAVINDEESDVEIVDLCAVDTAKKYMTWLRKTKKEGEIILQDIFVYDDPYDMVLVIGDRYNLRDFKNCVTLIKYKLVLSDAVVEKEEEWN